VSVDVKLLFTSIPLQLTLRSIGTAIQQFTVELPLPTEDIMDFLNFCLTSIRFQYNGKHCKQLHGTAMGSPVSLVVAEIMMQHVEKSALAACPHKRCRFGYATLTTLTTVFFYNLCALLTKEEEIFLFTTHTKKPLQFIRK